MGHVSEEKVLRKIMVVVIKTCVNVEQNVPGAGEGNVSAPAAVPYMYDRWPCLQRENKRNGGGVT